MLERFAQLARERSNPLFKLARPNPQFLQLDIGLACGAGARYRFRPFRTKLSTGQLLPRLASQGSPLIDTGRPPQADAKAESLVVSPVYGTKIFHIPRRLYAHQLVLYSLSA